MSHDDLDPKGYLPLIQPLLNRILTRLGRRGEKTQGNVTCCA